MKRAHAVALLSLATLILITARSLVATERMKGGPWEMFITENGQVHTKTHYELPEQAKGANGTPGEVRASLEKNATSLHGTIKDCKMENETIS